MTVSLDFAQAVSKNGWTIAQIADCITKVATTQQLSEEAISRTLLAWLNAVKHVGEHATGRRYTRLQFIENTLSAAGFALTLRDFGAWFDATGDWQPHALLPYAPLDSRITQRDERIDHLEHELHQMEVARNRAKAEVAFVVAERDQFFSTYTGHIYQAVSADYQNSASWRVTKPLRRLMAWRRGQKFAEERIEKPAIDDVTPPWQQAGYNIEKAWQAAPAQDFDRSDYAEWVRRYDNLGEDAVATLTADAQALAKQPSAPLFSVLMVLDLANSRADSQQNADWNQQWFKEAVASVQAQIYPKWELCIAVSSKAQPAVREALDGMAAQDSRIKLVHVPTGQDLLGAAIGAARGDWMVALSAINLIAIRAINTSAKVIVGSEKSGKNYDIIYTDSDKLVAPDFERSSPDFKPDWNLDLFLSTGPAQNYTQDLCFFKTSWVRSLGELDGFSGFELISRAMATDVAHNDAVQIHHIPQVLVHVRQVDAITKPVEYPRIRYPLPSVAPLVSLIIPTKNNVNLLRQCIDSILSKTSYSNYEVLVVDNGSDQAETLDYLHALVANPNVRVIRDNYAFNYSALNNDAISFAKGELVGLLNDDVEVISAEWLDEMVSHALRPGVGAVGARLWYPDKTLQHAGMVLVGGVARHVHKHLPQGEAGFNGRAALTQNFSAVTGACLVVRKALFEQVGGLNDQALAVGFNDVDFCLKLVEAGYRNVWTPYAELFHHESATRGQDDSPEKQRRAEKELRYMRQRWGDKLYRDPAYNPNLTDGHDDFSLAWPPR